jgi:hypothetical protein
LTINPTIAPRTIGPSHPNVHLTCNAYLVSRFDMDYYDILSQREYIVIKRIVITKIYYNNKKKLANFKAFFSTHKKNYEICNPNPEIPLSTVYICTAKMGLQGIHCVCMLYAFTTSTCGDKKI